MSDAAETTQAIVDKGLAAGADDVVVIPLILQSWLNRLQDPAHIRAASLADYHLPASRQSYDLRGVWRDLHFRGS